MKKPIMCGVDFARDATWSPIVSTREGAERWGNRHMPDDLKQLGFQVSICETDDYFRISYGRKV